MSTCKESAPLKIVVVGDGAVGKTCLLTTYRKGEFPTEYIPTIFENFVESQLVDGRMVPLSIWDTAGQETFDRCRLLAYRDTDVFILCFSLERPASFMNASTKWLNELHEHVGNVPILLVGTKADLRSSASNPVDPRKARKLVRSKKLKGYVECSAYTQEGVEEVFLEAVRATYPKPSLCPIL